MRGLRVLLVALATMLAIGVALATPFDGQAAPATPFDGQVVPATPFDGQVVPATPFNGQAVSAASEPGGDGERGETPLQAAAASGQADKVALLIQSGAALNEISARGATALGWAARNGDETITRLLLEAGADPDAASGPPRVPLALAVSRSHLGCARLLLDHGSRALAQPATAQAVLQALVEFVNAPDANGNEAAPAKAHAAPPRTAALGPASDATRRELADLLLPPLAALASRSEEFVVMAAESLATGVGGFVEPVIDGLGPAASSSLFRDTLLLRAAQRGRASVVRVALELGANVNALHPLGTPLSLALTRGDSDTIALLLDAGADTTMSAVPASKLSAEAAGVLEDQRTVALLERVDAIDARDGGGQTLLHRAAMRGDLLLTASLLRAKASPAIAARRWPGDEGWTPLLAAAAGGHPEIVTQLLAAGAAVDQRSAGGRTPLMLAAFYGRSGVAGLLLKAGADRNATDSVGLTPAALAAISGDAATSELLPGGAGNAEFGVRYLSPFADVSVRSRGPQRRKVPDPDLRRRRKP